MGNFFKSIGHGVEAVLGFTNRYIVPIAGALGGAIPGPLGMILQAVFTVEQLVIGPGQGAIKKQLAMDLVTSAFPQVNVDDLSKVIDSLVSALNAAGQLHASIAVPAAK